MEQQLFLVLLEHLFLNQVLKQFLNLLLRMKLSATFDSTNNKVVIAYRDDGNSFMEQQL